MIKFEININTQTFFCHLSKKPRKNINVRLKSGNNIYISKPKSVSQKHIINYLTDNSDWIFNKSVSLNSVANKRNTYITDDYVVVFDNKYSLKESLVNLESYEDLSKYLEKSLSNEILNKRKSLDKIMIDYKITLPKIKVKSMKNKWGSCYINDGIIYINKKLIHYPKFCLDYVLLHEYIHFIHPNHSKDFYKLVERYMPNYKQVVKYLKAN